MAVGASLEGERRERGVGREPSTQRVRADGAPHLDGSGPGGICDRELHLVKKDPLGLGDLVRRVEGTDASPDGTPVVDLLLGGTPDNVAGLANEVEEAARGDDHARDLLGVGDTRVGGESDADGVWVLDDFAPVDNSNGEDLVDTGDVGGVNMRVVEELAASAHVGNAAVGPRGRLRVSAGRARRNREVGGHEVPVASLSGQVLGIVGRSGGRGCGLSVGRAGGVGGVLRERGRF